MKLLLKNFQCPGDICTLTACIRDFKKAYPHVEICVETTAMYLWENNPFICRDKTNVDKTIDMHYPLIHNSTQGCYHFIHGFRKYLIEQLKMPFEQGNFQIDIHLSEDEKNGAWFKSLNLPTDKKVWIIDAGFKNDFTAKFWQFSRFQDIVNMTKNKITWCQIGELSHNHQPLKNAIDLRGKTPQRKIVELMYFSDGVLTPVSFPMHLSTMQTRNNRKRPCIVIAGSRQPSQWEAYPYHFYLHNNGLLKCSVNGACWKSRVKSLHDGDDKDNSICTNVRETSSGQIIPQCLNLITVQDVLRKIELILNNYDE